MKVYIGIDWSQAQHDVCFLTWFWTGGGVGDAPHRP